MPKFDTYFDDLTSCSLLGFLEHKRPTERTKAHSVYKGTLISIAKDDTTKLERKMLAQACLNVFEEQVNSFPVEQYWMDLAKYKLENEIYLEESQHVLDATKDTREQGHLLRKTITKSLMMISCLSVNQSGKIYHYRRIKNRLTQKAKTSSSVAKISSEGKQTERCSKDGRDNRDNKNLDFSTRSESTLECDDDDNSRIMSTYDYEKYKKSYTEMNNSNKWVLTTGTVVEDVLYNFSLRCKYEHLAHSFILDPDDNNYLIESVFTESELHEIRHYQTKETLLMPLELLKHKNMPFGYLNNKRLKNTLELQKQIFMPEQMDQDFNRSRDFDRDWIRNTVYNLLLEYESNALMSDHLELWILVHVWNFTYKVFNDIEEVKCTEAGRQFEGQNGTKLLQERGLKMPKMMKDMFDQLCKTFDQDEKKTRKLETIGFLYAGMFFYLILNLASVAYLDSIFQGLMMTLLRLDSPAGYICRVS
ncbi:uncharacterized protein OCT59_024825 [Rhizophagus irregularis]|nr:hypothetical protein OCT59_024825 [Rhizophagus irregularis]